MILCIVRTLITILFVSKFFTAFAQDEIPRCVSGLPILNKAQEEAIAKYRLFAKNTRQEELSLVIPVVVHVVYNTADQYFTFDQVSKQIDVLNQDFHRQNADTGLTPKPFKSVAGKLNLQFVLARQDPNGNPTNGITYTKTDQKSFSEYNDKIKFASSGGHDAWDTKNYLNIWVFNWTFALGLTNSISPGSDVDGVMITTKAFSTYGSLLHPRFNLGRTVTHEVGHWLGLKHIWGDAEYRCDTDEVDDTPEQYGRTSDALNCPIFPFRTSDDSKCTFSANGRMFSNYMDYSRDACMNMFSAGQVARMYATLMSLRPEILQSNGKISPFKQDIELAEITYDSGSYCTSVNELFIIKLRIVNKGSDTISGYKLSITSNEDSVDFEWRGSLIPDKDTVLEFGLRLNDKYIINLINAKLELLDGIMDGNLSNNQKMISFKCKDNLSIFPNPANEKLYFRGNTNKILSASVFDLSGREMFKYSSPVELNTSTLFPGYYLVLLELSDGNIWHEMIIVR